MEKAVDLIMIIIGSPINVTVEYLFSFASNLDYQITPSVMMFVIYDPTE